MRRHRIALIGTGASIDNHFSAFAALAERMELVAAVDIDAIRLKNVCDQYNIPNAYTSAATMLAEESPDLVIVVTPPATHKALIIQCLEAGALVWCEKPLVASLADFDTITAAEAHTGRFVTTVFQWRFGSGARHVRTLIANGSLGRPLVAVCHTLWYRTPEYYTVPWRGEWATEFGGPTMTLGIHLTDLLLWLLGDWDEVQAMIGTLDRDIRVEDVSMAQVRFANGAMGSIINSVLSPRQETVLRLDCQHATVEAAALYFASNIHWRCTQPPNTENAAVAAAWEALHSQPDVAGNHTAQLSNLLDQIEHGSPPEVRGEEGRRILEFNASLYKAALTRRPVRRGEITPDDPFYTAMHGGFA